MREKFLPVTLSSDAQDYANKKEIVLHLNGSINNISSSSLSSEFKLTSVSYLTQQFNESTWQRLFEYDIQDSDLIVFIGFSLRYDLDIKRLLWEDDKTRKKCVFIMAENEKTSNVRKAERYGTPFAIGLEAFGKIIEEKRLVRPISVGKIERPILCFSTPSIADCTITKVSDGSLTDLFLYGKIDDKLLQKSCEYSDKLPYYIKRRGIQTILTQLENGAKEILIHSDLGNGKTLFVRGLIYQMLKTGYKIYEYKKYYANLNDEIERICKGGDDNVVFVVENYNANRKIIESIQLFRNKQRLIVTERSVTNDMSYDWLLEQVRRDFYEVDVNRLEGSEIEQCISVFDHYGLWRKFSNYRNDQKRGLLTEKCRSNWRLILLEVILSADIRDRIRCEISKIKPDSVAYNAMILMFASNLLEWNIGLDDVSYALGNAIKGNSAFRHNEVVKEYIDFNNSELKVKSSILSEIILTHIMDVNIVRETLVKAFKNFDKQKGDIEYRKYMTNIMSYANLQRVFNKEEGDVFNSNIVSLFEDIRDCDFCKNNPHYWLQYAIAKLGEQKYDEAKLYFDNAYTYAKQKAGFDTYQIDNHYARYLLENVIYTSADDEYFKVFKEVHAILTDKSHTKDTKYYPYKIARNYLPFYEKFKGRMNKEENKQFIQACEQIKSMIGAYRNAIPTYRVKHEVREAEANIGKILNSI